MRRLFWLVLGVTFGAIVARKLSRAAARLTPSGMAQGLGQGLSDLAAALNDFAADVRAAMTEREAELRAGTGLDGTLGKPGDDGSAPAS
jgi:hypothetical protein